MIFDKYGRLYGAELRADDRAQDPYTPYTECEKWVFGAGSGKPSLWSL